MHISLIFSLNYKNPEFLSSIQQHYCCSIKDHDMGIIETNYQNLLTKIDGKW